MKPKCTADLSLFLTVTGLLLASFVLVPSSARAQDSVPEKVKHEFWPITQNPDSLLPRDESDTDYGGDQPEMDYNACEYSKKMDSLLNVIYRSIIRNAREDTDFVPYFKKAEARWVAYRDAELLAIMGGPETPENHGSMDPMCWCEYRSSMTRARIAELLMWVKALPFGDKSGCDTFDLYIPDEGKQNKKR